MFFKRLFGRKEQAAVDHLAGGATPQTQAEQDATRKHMESELTGTSEKRHVDGGSTH